MEIAYGYQAGPAAMAYNPPDALSEIIGEMMQEDADFAAEFNALQAPPQPYYNPPAYQPQPHTYEQQYQPWQNQQYAVAAYTAPPAIWQPPQGIADVLREALERRESGRSAPADITDKQMRALGKEHLILMLRDARAKLDQVSGEYEAFFVGVCAGLAQQGGGAQ